MAEAAEDGDTSALESALDGAFSGTPPPKAPAAPKAAPAPVEEAQPQQESTAEGEIEVPGEEEQQEAVPPSEPEIEIEVNGQKEIIRGETEIRELLVRGKILSSRDEEIARVREALATQAHLQQATQLFEREVSNDIAQLKALDAHLAKFNEVDWAAAIDTDMATVMKLQAQRQQLREQREMLLANLNGKHQQFQQGYAVANQRIYDAESKALLSRLPEWRDDGKAAAEKQAITRNLAGYGFQAAEIAQLMDHRMVLVARDAMKWRELQAAKGQGLKRVAEAPPVSKPGAAGAQTQQNAKTAFQKFTSDFRKAGRQGNHRAQETALEKVLSRTFK